MTDKKLPVEGTRISVYNIEGVTWEGKNHGVTISGVVTWVPSDSDNIAEWPIFYFLPDEPDITANGIGNTAREFNPHQGWQVYNKTPWTNLQYVINEISL